MAYSVPPPGLDLHTVQEYDAMAHGIRQMQAAMNRAGVSIRQFNAALRRNGAQRTNGDGSDFRPQKPVCAAQHIADAIAVDHSPEAIRAAWESYHTGLRNAGACAVMPDRHPWGVWVRGDVWRPHDYRRLTERIGRSVGRCGEVFGRTCGRCGMLLGHGTAALMRWIAL